MKPTKRQIEAGNDIAQKLFDASANATLNGQFRFTGDNCDLVSQYVRGEISSVEAIYVAMLRAKD